MKINQQSFLVVLFMVLFAFDALPAEKQPESDGKSARASKGKRADSKTGGHDELAWEEAIGQVRLLAAKFQQYRDTAVAARSLAGLASVVCKYDKTQAPVLFSRAMELAQAGLTSSETSASKEQLWQARAVVISSAAECDSQLAEQLNRNNSSDGEEKTDPNKYWSDLRTAQQLLSTDQPKAIQFAQTTSQHIARLQGMQLDHFYGLLWKMRKQAPAAADQVFLQALDQLGQNPALAVRPLTVLANYVFAPAGAENTDGTYVAPFGEPDDYRASWFQVERTGATPAAVQAYLQTAAQVLSTLSPGSEKEAGAGFALAQQLHQRSLEVAPDLAPEYEAAVQRISPLFPEGPRRSFVSKALMALQTGEGEKALEEELEKSLDARRRDQIRLTLFAIRWARKEVSKAEKLAAGIEDDSLKTQLLSLVVFRRAEMALTNKDLEQAHLHSRALKSPLHRALVFLGMAQQYEERKESEQATAFLNSAIRETENIEGGQRPYILVSAATVGAALDAQRGLRNLEDAVAGLNLLDTGSIAASERRNESSNQTNPPVSFLASSRSIVEFAYAGNLRRHFDLRIPGLTFDVSDATKALRSSPPEHLTAALFSLQSEARQGPALAAAAAAYLQRAKSSKSGSSRN